MERVSANKVYIKMRLEEFLRKWGTKYRLRVIEKKDGMLHITICSEEVDGDQTSRDFLVKDNLVFPIE